MPKKENETKEEREFRKLQKNLNNSNKIIMTDETNNDVVKRHIRKVDETDDEGDAEDGHIAQPKKEKRHTKHSHPIAEDVSDTNKSSSNDDEMTFTNRHSDILSKLKNQKKNSLTANSKSINMTIKPIGKQSNPPSVGGGQKTIDAPQPPATNQPNKPYERMGELQQDVKTYVAVDDEIRKLELRAKELKAQRKETQENILVHLDRIGEDYINITDGILNIKRKSTGGALKRDTVENVLASKIGETKIKEEIINSIDEVCNASKKITVSIERKFERGATK
jgi:hypothetical protein